MPAIKKENHRIERIGWLRAAVLGANDGILSTASLVLGVASAHVSHTNVMAAGIAGLVAGAMSMAAGEYVSVHSQADTEHADLALERKELKTDNKGEHQELARIYVGRGLAPALAKEVARQLMAHDALGAHARDEQPQAGRGSTHPPQRLQMFEGLAGAQGHTRQRVFRHVGGHPRLLGQQLEALRRVLGR